MKTHPPISYRGARQAMPADIELTGAAIDQLCAQWITDARLWLAPLAENLPVTRGSDIQTLLNIIIDNFSDLSAALQRAADEAQGIAR